MDHLSQLLKDRANSICLSTLLLRTMIEVIKKGREMDFKEMTLEDIIWDNSQSPEGRKLLKERGLSIEGQIYRQLQLGSYGRADLITINYDKYIDRIDITVYELKKGCITVEALLQAYRYVTALRRHGLSYDYWDSEIEFQICLIGDSVDTKSDFTFLYNEMEHVTIYTYDYSITGIIFKEIGQCWFHTEEQINEETQNTLTDYLLIKMEEGPENDMPK